LDVGHYSEAVQHGLAHQERRRAALGHELWKGHDERRAGHHRVEREDGESSAAIGDAETHPVTEAFFAEAVNHCARWLAVSRC